MLSRTSFSRLYGAGYTWRNGTVDDPTATISVTVDGKTYAATNNGDGTWTLADDTIAPALAGGIYEAMITTAAGLLVAIPTLICYHWLSARVQGLVMEIDEKTVEFLESLDAEAPPALEVRQAPAAADASRDGLPATAGAVALDI